MPRLRARLPAPATVAHQIAGYWSGDHRSRRGDEDEQHCYSHSWRIALLERFWQARHPPRYAAYLTPSSPSFPHSSQVERVHGRGHPRRVRIPVQKIEWNRLLAEQVVADDEGPDQIVGT